MITIPRMVTLQLQTFLPYVNSTLKYSYRTGILLSNFITGQESVTETYFAGRQPLMENNLCWRMTLDGRQPSMKDNLRGSLQGSRYSSVRLWVHPPPFYASNNFLVISGTLY